MSRNFNGLNRSNKLALLSGATGLAFSMGVLSSCAYSDEEARSDVEHCVEEIKGEDARILLRDPDAGSIQVPGGKIGDVVRYCMTGDGRDNPESYEGEYKTDNPNSVLNGGKGFDGVDG